MKLFYNPVFVAVVVILYLGFIGPALMSAPSDIAVLLAILLGAGVVTLIYKNLKKACTK